MQQNPCWEINSNSASQEISRNLWNSKVYYHVHKIPPLVPIMSQMHPFYNIPPHFLRSILILFSRLCLDLSCGLFPSGFPTKIVYAFLISAIHARCPAHHIFLDLITLKIFSEPYKLRSSSLCSLLQSPARFQTPVKICLLLLKTSLRI
jgi:hypothetical protein